LSGPSNLSWRLGHRQSFSGTNSASVAPLLLKQSQMLRHSHPAH